MRADANAGDAQASARVGAAERALVWCEIASVVTSALVAEWAVLALGDWHKLALAVPVGLAFALMLASHRARGETRAALGLTGRNFWRALRLLALPMLAGALLLALAGRVWFGAPFVVGQPRAGWEFFGLPVWGFVWGLVQQYALQGFINRRLQLLWGAGWRTTLTVAALFALLHLPNPWLTAATLMGGLMWAAVYQRAPNLWALALSHAVMTWVLVSTIPASALAGLRVGYKYFG
ncbi:MAG TPA: CPBP family intramembrane glutamic endopeptidase [Pyrinomonadaceae bacterium]